MQKRNSNTKEQATVAVGFHHPDGFVPAYKQAGRFAGKEGRIATMPDIINARLHNNTDTAPWGMYFTTMSAEYFGQSRAGNKILIVAHGTGPLATLSGVLAAYAHEYTDKNRDKRGGRISQEEFWKLESGQYGNVSVIDFDGVCSRYTYPFLETLRASQALREPLVAARLGPNAEEYITQHADHARKWHAEQSGFDPENRYQLPHHADYCVRRKKQHSLAAGLHSDPYIIRMEDASNCGYTYYPLEPGLAMAHLLSTGGLVNLHHDGGNESLVNDVSCHEWWCGLRLLAVRGMGPVTTIHPGNYNLSGLMAKHWQELMRPVKNPPPESGFYHLVQFGGKYFTEYPKKGERLDTGEPQFLVTEMQPVNGGPREFRTIIGGHPVFAKYGINEVQHIAPPQANAYTLPGEFTINGKYHVSPVQFFKVRVDTTKRLLRSKEVMADYETLMSLLDI